MIAPTTRSVHRCKAYRDGGPLCSLGIDDPKLEEPMTLVLDTQPPATGG